MDGRSQADAAPIIRAVDGPHLRCAFETLWCRNRAALAGGFDLHHPDPLSFGGAPGQQTLILCPLHHRRAHALARAMVEHDSTSLRFARPFAPVELATARTAYGDWVTAGRPKVSGWPCDAAVTR